MKIHKNSISHNLQTLHSSIEDIAVQHKRAVSSISLMAVSKTYSMEFILEAYRCGQVLFGENRVQESMEKFSTENTNVNGIDIIHDALSIEMKTNTHLHLIGSLQTNKVKKALEHFDCIESIDSMPLIDACHKALHKQAQETQVSKKQFPIFLQVTCSDYDYKHGFNDIAILKKAVESILEQGQLSIKGIMTIAPHSSEEIIVRNAFAETRIWKEHIEREYGLRDLQLSMGMSSDYHWAIAEGSTMVRIGSLIFGARI